WNLCYCFHHMYFDVWLDVAAFFKVQARNKVSVYVYCYASSDQYDHYIFVARSRHSTIDPIIRLRGTAGTGGYGIGHYR
ncbi:MAG: hypothetical protein NC246_05750, partial [Muribaculaceae bacterium]|nr:hypothetical protein [Muribaculaceae bacterium]